jgi:cyclopropane-fatty-acyl-phospholipid synthase
MSMLRSPWHDVDPAPPIQGRFSIRIGDTEITSPAPGQEAAFTLVFRDAAVLHVLEMKDLVEWGEAYLEGHLDIEGDIEAAYSHLRDLVQRQGQEMPPPTFGGPDPSTAREQLSHHYDLPVEFWRPWLGDTMLYTCAYYRTPSDDLSQAQNGKVERICEKLQLQSSDRLLDVGCGWGGLSVHAAVKHGVHVTAVTLGELQAAYVRKRIQDAGIQNRCEVIVSHYQSLASTGFDKIASVGISEHVGNELSKFFESLHARLRPGGLLMNQGIVCAHDSEFKGGRGFIEKFIFPGARLQTLSHVLGAAESQGFGIVDVEDLSEHYVLTLREWRRRLEANASEIVGLVGERRYRAYRAYLTGFAAEFEGAQLRVYQTLLQRTSTQRMARPLRRV